MNSTQTPHQQQPPAVLTQAQELARSNQKQNSADKIRRDVKYSPRIRLAGLLASVKGVMDSHAANKGTAPLPCGLGDFITAQRIITFLK